MNKEVAYKMNKNEENGETEKTWIQSRLDNSMND
jgi:hypothetical protein